MECNHDDMGVAKVRCAKTCHFPTQAVAATATVGNTGYPGDTEFDRPLDPIERSRHGLIGTLAGAAR
jgi:hypothetical protein